MASQWRFFTILIADDESVMAVNAKKQLIEVLSGELTPRRSEVFKVVQKSELDQIISSNVASEESSPETLYANAFLQFIEKDKTHCLLRKCNARNDLSDELAAAAAAPTLEGYTEEQIEDLLCAAQLVIDADRNDATPDRIYILYDFPSTFNQMVELLKPEIAKNRYGELIDGTVTLGTAAFVNEKKSVSGDIPQALIQITMPGEEKIDDKNDEDAGLEAEEVTAEEKVKAEEETPQEPPEEEEDDTPGREKRRTSLGCVAQPPSKIVQGAEDEASSGSSLWVDFIFEYIAAERRPDSPRTATDVLSEFMELIQRVAFKKCLFKEWIKSTTLLNVPREEQVLKHQSAEKRALNKVLRKVYNESLASLFEASVGVAGVLYGLREAVAIGAEEPQPAIAVNEKNPHHSLYGDEAGLSIQKSNIWYQSQAPSARSGDPNRAPGGKIVDMEHQMWKTLNFPGIGNNGRRGMPPAALLSLCERGILDNQIRNFTNMDLEDIHFSKKLVEMERMLMEHDPAANWKGNIRLRSHIERLSPVILPQRLAQIMREEPEIYKSYFSATDSLLLLAHIPTAPGRYGVAEWSARKRVRYRPPFKDWEFDYSGKQDYITPRTIEAMGYHFNLTSEELDILNEVTHTFFPADLSSVRLVETQHFLPTLTVFKDDHAFGLRPIKSQAEVAADSPVESLFRASFSDRSQVVIAKGPASPHKPDGYGTVEAVHTFPNCLAVACCSDGSVRQEYVTKVGHVNASVKNEKLRLIFGRGIVVKELLNGDQVIMYANGTTSSRAKGSNEFIQTDIHGEQQSISYDDNGMVRSSEVLDPLPATSQVDALSHSTIFKNDRNVLVVVNVDGSICTHHSDGTKILTSADHTHVIVEHAAFAQVSIDVDVDQAARKHANGKKIAVTKGGIRTRSTIRVFDDTVIEINYDTRVISKVNGIIRSRKPDGTVIIATDDTLVEYQPRTLVSQRAKATEEDIVDPRAGVYFFHFETSACDMYDHENNTFHMELRAAFRTSVMQVDLAGEVRDEQAIEMGIEPITAKAIVNHPRPPYAFILEGNGCGAELLRPDEVEDLYYLCEHDNRVNLTTLDAPDQASHRHHTIIRELNKHFDYSGQCTFADQERLVEMKKLSELPLCLKTTSAMPLEISPVFEVRQITQIVPFTDTRIESIEESLSKWENWCSERQRTEEHCEVYDPRDEQQIQEEAAIQKQILVVYKAAKARRKAEKQKLKEANEWKMDAVQEGDEDEEFSEDEMEDVLELESESGDSRDDFDGEMDEDGPFELMSSAFNDADADNMGQLTVQQTRGALVNVLGYGVPTKQLTELLKHEMEDYEDRISFQAFTSVLETLRELNDAPEATGATSLPAHRRSVEMGQLDLTEGYDTKAKKLKKSMRKEPAGSATEAIRAAKMTRTNQADA